MSINKRQYKQTSVYTNISINKHQYKQTSV